MWCIGRITAEYRERMYDLLGLYAEPYNPAEPVVCLDEKSKQLLQQTRRPIVAGPGQIAKEDYEYKRAGTRNLFVAVEPKAGHREVEVTCRRTKADFVAFVQFLAREVYAQASKIHLVLDNLNMHFRASFEQGHGAGGGHRHYTDKRGNQHQLRHRIVQRKIPPRGRLQSKWENRPSVNVGR